MPRVEEVKALISDLDRIADGGSGIRFVIGEFGSGKTFFLYLIRSIALARPSSSGHRRPGSCALSGAGAQYGDARQTGRRCARERGRAVPPWRVLSVDVERRTVDLEPSPAGRAPRFTGGGAEGHERIRQEMKAVYESIESPAFPDLLGPARRYRRRFPRKEATTVPVL
jgi:hypothetical protein